MHSDVRPPLQGIRYILDLTQSQVAQELDNHPSYVSMMETGKRPPSQEYLDYLMNKTREHLERQGPGSYQGQKLLDLWKDVLSLERAERMQEFRKQEEASSQRAKEIELMEAIEAQEGPPPFTVETERMSVEDYLQALDNLFACSRMIDAVSLGVKATKTHPNSPEIHTWMSIAHGKAGDNRSALREANWSIKLKKTPMAFSTKALASILIGKRDDAIDACQQVINLSDPKGGHEWSNLGVAMFLLDPGIVCNKAREYLQRGTEEAEPNNEWPWIKWAAVLNQIGHHAEATRLLHEAARINDKNAWQWGERGIALYHLGRYEDAVMAFGNARAFGENTAYVLFYQAETWMLLEDQKAAYEVFDRALELFAHQPKRTIYQGKGVITTNFVHDVGCPLAINTKRIVRNLLFADTVDENIFDLLMDVYQRYKVHHVLVKEIYEVGRVLSGQVVDSTVLQRRREVVRQVVDGQNGFAPRLR